MIWFLIGVLSVSQYCYARKVVLPESDPTLTEQLENGTPTSSPDVIECKENMTRYLADDGNGIICDCIAGYLYYSSNDECYLPYRRGPCSEAEYLVFNQADNTISCDSNPCEIDGLVKYNDTCHELNKAGDPCADHQILTVNDENFDIYCKFRFAKESVITAPLKKCSAGSRRNTRGQCKSVI